MPSAYQGEENHAMPTKFPSITRICHTLTLTTRTSSAKERHRFISIHLRYHISHQLLPQTYNISSNMCDDWNEPKINIILSALPPIRWPPMRSKVHMYVGKIHNVSNPIMYQFRNCERNQRLFMQK